MDGAGTGTAPADCGYVGAVPTRIASESTGGLGEKAGYGEGPIEASPARRRTSQAQAGHGEGIGIGTGTKGVSTVDALRLETEGLVKADGGVVVAEDG
jgi:hypothetical protein